MTTPKIYPAMVAIMRDMDGIAKAQVNSHQRYQYRGIDDLYNHCHSILAKNGVFCLPEVLKCEREAIETAGGKSAVSTMVTVKFRFFAEDGSSVEVIQIGEGMDLGDKSAAKALSTAQKYALIQTFLIPTEGQMKDPEEDSLERKPTVAPAEATIPHKAKKTQGATENPTPSPAPSSSTPTDYSVVPPAKGGSISLTSVKTGEEEGFRCGTSWKEIPRPYLLYALQKSQSEAYQKAIQEAIEYRAAQARARETASLGIEELVTKFRNAKKQETKSRWAEAIINSAQPTKENANELLGVLCELDEFAFSMGALVALKEKCEDLMTFAVKDSRE